MAEFNAVGVFKLISPCDATFAEYPVEKLSSLVSISSSSFLCLPENVQFSRSIDALKFIWSSPVQPRLTRTLSQSFGFFSSRLEIEERQFSLI